MRNDFLMQKLLGWLDADYAVRLDNPVVMVLKARIFPYYGLSECLMRFAANGLRPEDTTFEFQRLSDEGDWRLTLCGRNEKGERIMTTLAIAPTPEEAKALF